MKSMAYPSAPGSTGAGDPAGAGGDDRRAETRDGHRSLPSPLEAEVLRAEYGRQRRVWRWLTGGCGPEEMPRVGDAMRHGVDMGEVRAVLAARLLSGALEARRSPPVRGASGLRSVVGGAR